MDYANVINVVELVNYALGITSYSFILFCLLFRTSHDLGTYRYLQIFMVTVDATYTTVQLFIRERIITATGLFLMIPTSPYSITTEALCAYLALYNLTFVMIDYSFLYRMWAIKSPSRVRLFSDPLFFFLLFSMAFIETLLWYWTIIIGDVPTEKGRLRVHEFALREFGVDTMRHVMIMGDYFMEDGSLNMPPFTAMLILSAVMSICFGFMLYAFSQIIRHLKEAKLISKTSLRLQRQLFITLCLQVEFTIRLLISHTLSSTRPVIDCDHTLICLYAPCGFTILLPPLRIDCQFIARVTPLLISCFLPLDTLAVILSMTDYRREVLKLLRCYRTPTVCVVKSTQSAQDFIPNY